MNRLRTIVRSTWQWPLYVVLFVGWLIADLPRWSDYSRRRAFLAEQQRSASRPAGIRRVEERELP